MCFFEILIRLAVSQKKVTLKKTNTLNSIQKLFIFKRLQVGIINKFYFCIRVNKLVSVLQRLT